ncbi:MAG: RNA ligase family protein [Stappiaceae bacterium]
MKILKYPRTRHIEGSRLQVGDKSDDKPLAELVDVPLVVEEKVDGANCAISFGDADELLLQSRGHYLTGGPRERHFDLLKSWAAIQQAAFHAVLGRRYIMYGEWLLAKHTVFYDKLSHYFMEFDVFDRERERFLSTNARKQLLAGLPVMPVPVVHTGAIANVDHLMGCLRPSLYKSSNWRDVLREAAIVSGSRADFVEKQTDDSELAEGLYIKVEANGLVEERYKFVRADFLQAIENAEGHWLDRPILQNGLMEGIDIFSSELGCPGAYDEK